MRFQSPRPLLLLLLSSFGFASAPALACIDAEPCPDEGATFLLEDPTTSWGEVHFASVRLTSGQLEIAAESLSRSDFDDRIDERRDRRRRRARGEALRRDEGADQSAPIQFVWGAHFGFPFITSVSGGFILGERESDRPAGVIQLTDHEITGMAGMVAEVEVGITGARLGIGGGALIYRGPLQPIAAVTLEASVLYLWTDLESLRGLESRSGEDGAPNSLYVGGEISLQLVVNATLGFYGRLLGDTGEEEYMIRWSFGGGI
jgi:hypothetical protein